ncbi:hypothetical protein BMW23_0985 [Bodo saltans virus]|uniref:Uncharacterized protein n=1 Tax=Bodo saltans virus TaxID=2024608 RepID=A0A2H4UVU0_9VIRU|nr:hypothetical protein QJ851_gp0967 [Bodo saltans virus]ATZ81030.1 hypothetical protein BMW23_0985 [Bodo saltans virus]
MTTQMQNDAIPDASQPDVSQATRTVLTSEKFIDSISIDIKKIMADGVITISDVPTILVVLLKSETFVETLKNTANQTNVSSVPFSKIMKYCSMGLFYYFMLNNNTNEDDLTSFLFTYPALWSLVELQLPSMDNTSETTPVTATTVQSKTTVKRCC